jgi:hypothetical protein
MVGFDVVNFPPLFMRIKRKIGINPNIISNKNDSHPANHRESTNQTLLFGCWFWLGFYALAFDNFYVGVDRQIV